ncbi:hypothetical protein QNH48_26335 [Neobacillus sp. YX16]|uniref:hypothetical protein n=1 Tax=Neobacillus sp. YX16 TaxID=3047874 RepID=UPI0024C2905A|nr:hypothetical protein [Neobacillus sp. YX16]WHZ02420.1 hypothetical protein QNH48_26335 [Neobacillus sp. YX16]
MSRKSMPVTGLVMGMVLLVCILTVFMLIKGAWFSPDKEAVAVVEEFYRFEQEGEFSSSWSLFHSTMKEKFSKGSYIQDRAHVFMNHFGVETFDFTVSEPEEIDQWKMSKTGPAMKNVYKILVTQTYKGKYGNFDLEQEVIIVKEKEEWKIVWDYNQ